MSQRAGTGETWLVTGGAGFIGSNFILSTLLGAEGDPRVDGGAGSAGPDVHIVNYDKLTYAGRLDNLAAVAAHPRYRFVRGDIGDAAQVRAVLQHYQPDAIIHFAAESHVDRSIDGPAVFVQTNIVGTFVLAEVARAFWDGLPEHRRARFRFLQVSTDEVYGSLGPTGVFTESSPFAPSSPYAASKAAADHLLRASFITHGFPVIISHASNNFGPYQFPEKLIPVIITSALDGREIPIYGDGGQVRDWLSVHDHCQALRFLIHRGTAGERYNIGGQSERTNLELAHAICALIDERRPGSRPARELIRMVEDRPGHDRRYAVDCTRMHALGWAPRQPFEDALRATVAWYIDNRELCVPIDQDDVPRPWLGVSGEGTRPA